MIYIIDNILTGTIFSTWQLILWTISRLTRSIITVTIFALLSFYSTVIAIGLEINFTTILDFSIDIFKIF